MLEDRKREEREEYHSSRHGRGRGELRQAYIAMLERRKRGLHCWDQSVRTQLVVRVRERTVFARHGAEMRRSRGHLAWLIGGVLVVRVPVLNLAVPEIACVHGGE